MLLLAKIKLLEVIGICSARHTRYTSDVRSDDPFKF